MKDIRQLKSKPSCLFSEQYFPVLAAKNLIMDPADLLPGALRGRKVLDQIDAVNSPEKDLPQICR
ncbi:hypothetical protein [uncultured Desulfosarcina sp.]|uniref:hypothetical protein n=1 Tax=uncultured Desulfosarcina sp. TaxID=218289 RepID=UPI0029C950CD|nr:hypothetical protein [uncultured Desulfosarcina sp.]